MFAPAAGIGRGFIFDGAPDGALGGWARLVGVCVAFPPGGVALWRHGNPGAGGRLDGGCGRGCGRLESGAWQLQGSRRRQGGDRHNGATRRRAPRPSEGWQQRAGGRARERPIDSATGVPQTFFSISA